MIANEQSVCLMFVLIIVYHNVKHVNKHMVLFSLEMPWLTIPFMIQYLSLWPGCSIIMSANKTKITAFWQLATLTTTIIFSALWLTELQHRFVLPWLGWNYSFCFVIAGHMSHAAWMYCNLGVVTLLMIWFNPGVLYSLDRQHPETSNFLWQQAIFDLITISFFLRDNEQNGIVF